MEPIISEAVPRKNRIITCPSCTKGSFLNDKNAKTSPKRFIYRDRICLKCRTRFYTKQGPEEITTPLGYRTEYTENRIHTCPDCKGKLSGDRDAYTSMEESDRGFIYRHRVCLKCGMDVYTKQPPEEITSIEPPLR